MLFKSPHLILELVLSHHRAPWLLANPLGPRGRGLASGMHGGTRASCTATTMSQKLLDCCPSVCLLSGRKQISRLSSGSQLCREGIVILFAQGWGLIADRD